MSSIRRRLASSLDVLLDVLHRRIGNRLDGLAEAARTPPAVRPVLIFGAGPDAVRLQRTLERVSERAPERASEINERYKPVGFIGDPASKHTLNGLPVIPPEGLAEVIARQNIGDVVLAPAGIKRKERNTIIKLLQAYPVRMMTVSNGAAVASNAAESATLRPLDIEDLFGRESGPQDQVLNVSHIRGKVVMITGAGGSIGAELTRQLLGLEPEMLVLFELSEGALYEISSAVEALQQAIPTRHRTRIVTVLGSVLDRRLVSRTIADYGVQVIYHAAAYKHVPLVELNAFAGIQNNTFGTLAIAEEAQELGVERFVLISSDKAVRPTNIMGASKRLAELILQALAEDPGAPTIFTMVRFGNVLNSSGSVVQRFRRQIETGGPVTVTHREMMRYFMSIPEAAQLVIQAGAMAMGGDMFVLDMGQPVKIDDLARCMIRLAGQTARDRSNPDGDIAIEYVGLRPGEKLYEELLIGETTTGTSHPRIFKMVEPMLPFEDLAAVLERLEEAMHRNDEGELQDMLRETVEGYCQTNPSRPLATRRAWPAVPRTIH